MSDLQNPRNFIGYKPLARGLLRAALHERTEILQTSWRHPEVGNVVTQDEGKPVEGRRGKRSQPTTTWDDVWAPHAMVEPDTLGLGKVEVKMGHILGQHRDQKQEGPDPPNMVQLPSGARGRGHRS